MFTEQDFRDVFAKIEYKPDYQILLETVEIRPAPTKFPPPLDKEIYFVLKVKHPKVLWKDGVTAEVRYPFAFSWNLLKAELELSIDKFKEDIIMDTFHHMYETVERNIFDAWWMHQGQLTEDELESKVE